MSIWALPAWLFLAVLFTLIAILAGDRVNIPRVLLVPVMAVIAGIVVIGFSAFTNGSSSGPARTGTHCPGVAVNVHAGC